MDATSHTKAEQDQRDRKGEPGRASSTAHPFIPGLELRPAESNPEWQQDRHQQLSWVFLEGHGCQGPELGFTGRNLESKVAMDQAEIGEVDDHNHDPDTGQ